MQIDWISAITKTGQDLWLPYQSGQNLRIDPSGQVVNRRPAFHQVEDSEPSSSKSFMVWTPSPDTLYLSGNPCKLLQGHNLWGSTDTNGLYCEAGDFVRRHAGLFPSPGTWDALQFTKPRYTRLDVTRSYRFESNDDAMQYIRYVAGNAKSRHGAAKLFESGTAYFGQKSTRWTMKIYAKEQELRRSLKSQIGRLVDDSLFEWSRGIVRFELTLRSPELEKLPVDFNLSDCDSLRALWQRYYNTIQFNENASMTNSSLLVESLPRELRRTYELWSAGKDLRALISKTGFYRHRREILHALAVDIAVPPTTESLNKASAGLDPAAWEPEPLSGGLVEPSPHLKAAYRLL